MFNLLDIIIVRPIVNILFLIYSVVGDFGLAIILFTIVVKLLTWPLMKRQINQTKMMRKIQPELAEIKKNCKGNRQMESLQMMDLYKKNNIKPMRSMLSILIQFPIFIALFTAINVSVRPCAVNEDYNVPINTCTNKTDTTYSVEHSAYPFVRPLNNINTLIEQQSTYFRAYEKDAENAKYEFEPKLFGVVDLFARPSSVFKEFNLSNVIIFLFALASAGTQFIMARQNDVTRKKGQKGKSLRAMMKEAADGKDISQDEINAYSQSQMTYMMPIMMFFIMINLPGAIVLYYLLNTGITVILQKIVLNKNLDVMEEAADKKVLKELRDATKKIQEGEIVSEESTKGPKITKVKSTTHYASNNKNKKDKTHITRITASDKKKRR
ncbi:YidC/Oxa1 family membrane protein insertase [Candidatus Saccharibacteria bacterium]|nr:YidC/Oxa1 family membrane protein insertase [Candidatus Saccharibacteria bacterium]